MNPEYTQKEIMERARSYYNKSLPEIHSFIRTKTKLYDLCNTTIRKEIESTATSYIRDALTKSEAILLLLALTRYDFEDIKAIPEKDLPLHINDQFIYPDIESFFKKRLKNIDLSKNK